MKEKNFMRRRAWLNPPSSEDTGAISAFVSANAFWISAEVEIRDCARQITLDFGGPARRESAIDERIKKLDKIISILTDVRNSLGPAREHAAEQIKELKEKKGS